MNFITGTLYNKHGKISVMSSDYISWFHQSVSAPLRLSPPLFLTLFYGQSVLVDHQVSKIPKIWKICLTFVNFSPTFLKLLLYSEKRGHLLRKHKFSISKIDLYLKFMHSKDLLKIAISLLPLYFFSFGILL